MVGYTTSACRQNRLAVARTSFMRPCPGNAFSAIVTSPARANSSISRFTALRSRCNRSDICVIDPGISFTARNRAKRAPVMSFITSAGSSKLVMRSSGSQPIINLLRDHLLDADLVHADETTIQVLKGPGKKAQFIAAIAELYAVEARARELMPECEIAPS